MFSFHLICCVFVFVPVLVGVAFNVIFKISTSITRFSSDPLPCSSSTSTSMLRSFHFTYIKTKKKIVIIILILIIIILICVFLITLSYVVCMCVCVRECFILLLTLLFIQVFIFARVIVVAVIVVIVIDRFLLFGFITTLCTVFRNVWLFVEIVEQEIEEDGIWQCEANRPSWIAAVTPEQLWWMQESHTELNLLTNTKRKREKNKFAFRWSEIESFPFCCCASLL